MSVYKVCSKIVSVYRECSRCQFKNVCSKIVPVSRVCIKIVSVYNVHSKIL